MRQKGRRKPAEFVPSENAPDSAALELPNAPGVRSRAKTLHARLQAPRFAETDARATSGKARPCSAGRIHQKIRPRPNTAAALQTAGLHCKEPRLGTNPSTTATPGFSRSQISRAPEQIIPASPALFPADWTPWLHKPGISLPRTPFPVSGNANNLRARSLSLRCSDLVLDKFRRGPDSTAPARAHPRFFRTLRA